MKTYTSRQVKYNRKTIIHLNPSKNGFKIHGAKAERTKGRIIYNLRGF